MNELHLLSWLRETATRGRAREMRLSAHLSRSEVACAVGVDPSTIARWEEGRRVPRGDAAIRYARLLKTLAR